MIHARAFFLALLLIGVPSAARAHSPIEGLGFFYGGMLHPLLLPAHLLLLVALGLWIGQQGIRHIEIGLPAFVAGLVPGLVCAGLGAVSAIPAPLLLIPAALGGLCVASAWRIPREGIGVGALTCAFLIGVDSAPEATAGRETLLALLGVGLGAGFLLIHLSAMCEFFQRPWQRIAFRIAGSWICAIAIMVLALEFAPEPSTSPLESPSVGSEDAGGFPAPVAEAERSRAAP
jgi:urease accessory protein